MYALVALSFVLGATAVSPRSCSFGLTASGKQSGTIGQLSDGQNRIGGGLVPATFTIDNGGITDAAGRGCILTESVEQFQCDEGKSPTYGFAIDSNGTLTSSGASIFYACPASDTEWNLYTTPVLGQKKCVEISLTATGCGSTASSYVSVMTVTVTAQNCGVTSSTPAISTTEELSQAVTSVQPSVVETTYRIPAENPSAQQTVKTSVISTEAPSVESATESMLKTSIISSEVPWTTSTVYISTVYTITSCASTMTDCPGRIGSVTTETISQYTTLCPVTQAQSTTVKLQTSTAFVETQRYTSRPVSTWISTLQTKTKPTWYSTWSNTTSTAASTSTQGTSTCIPTVLSGSSTSGNYQYPHLIVPVNSSSPSTAYGTQYFGDISASVSTLFNFDIPTSYSGKTCSLVFLLPLRSQLETSSYDFSGNGGVDFAQLSSAVTLTTTYDSVPNLEKDLGAFALTEGSSTLVDTFTCPAGETLSYEMSAVGNTDLYYFQDWNPSPLGLYITYC